MYLLTNMAAKYILFFILFSGLVVSIAPQNNNHEANSNANVSRPDSSANSVSWEDYREVLENERKLLDEQSERYYLRIDLNSQTSHDRVRVTRVK